MNRNSFLQRIVDRLRQVVGLSNSPPPLPFYRLNQARTLEGQLPEELAWFYRHHEGIGLESHPDHLIRICKLHEVQRIKWKDLHVIGGQEMPGWENFTAYRIGVSSYFDEIVFVVDSPACPSGSILVTGVDIIGPGGQGPYIYSESLILARNMQEWIRSLQETNWNYIALHPGEYPQLPPSDRKDIGDHLRSLNPKLNWPENES